MRPTASGTCSLSLRERHGTTILIASHDPTLREHVDRSLAISDGQRDGVRRDGVGPRRSAALRRSRSSHDNDPADAGRLAAAPDADVPDGAGHGARHRHDRRRCSRWPAAPSRAPGSSSASAAPTSACSRRTPPTPPRRSCRSSLVSRLRATPGVATRDTVDPARERRQEVTRARSCSAPNRTRS